MNSSTLIIVTRAGAVTTLEYTNAHEQLVIKDAIYHLNNPSTYRVMVFHNTVCVFDKVDRSQHADVEHTGEYN